MILGIIFVIVCVILSSIKQIDEYDKVVEELEKAGINVGIKHLMNGLGLLRFNNDKYDMVRPGLLLYGLSPHNSGDK